MCVSIKYSGFFSQPKHILLDSYKQKALFLCTVIKVCEEGRFCYHALDRSGGQDREVYNHFFDTNTCTYDGPQSVKYSSFIQPVAFFSHFKK